MSETNLLPCPMCGCTEILVKKRKTTMVECKDCGVAVFNYQDGVERDAIEHWNRRALPAAAAPSGWHGIESAPRDHVTEFDGWNGERVPNVSWGRPEYWPRGKEAWTHFVYEYGQGWIREEVKGLTHWMPLPAAPDA